MQSSSNRGNSGVLISHNVVEWGEVVAYEAKRNNFTCKICNKVILYSFYSNLLKNCVDIIINHELIAEYIGGKKLNENVKILIFTL